MRAQQGDSCQALCGAGSGSLEGRGWASGLGGGPCSKCCRAVPSGKEEESVPKGKPWETRKGLEGTGGRAAVGSEQLQVLLWLSVPHAPLPRAHSRPAMDKAQAGGKAMGPSPHLPRGQTGQATSGLRATTPC